MKNIIFSLVAVLFLSTACQDNNSEEYLFKDNPNARFEKLKNNYVNILTSAENGWIGYYAPNNEVGGYALLMKFDKEGNIIMASDYNQGGNDNTSTYRIDKKLKVQLVFETHAVLHQIYETNQNGVEGEYVFNILNVTDDTVELESATDFGYDGSGVTKLTLKKADAEHWNFQPIYKNLEKLSAGDADYVTFMDYSKKRIYVKDTEISKSFEFVFDVLGAQINRYAKITTTDAEGNVSEEQLPIFVKHEGFSFVEPYKFNDKEIQNFVFDTTIEKFVSNDGGQTTIIENVANPIPEDTKAYIKLHKFNVSKEYSEDFKKDFLEPLKTLAPDFKAFQVYKDYQFRGSRKKYNFMSIYEYDGKNRKWHSVYYNELKMGSRKDVVNFDKPGKKKKLWLEEDNPIVKKLYDFFFAKEQSFYVKHLSFGDVNGFMLIDRDNPKYWIYF